LKLGITPTKIFLLSGWRESTMFSAQERAVLAWTEALTHVSQAGAPQALYDDLKAHFDEAQILQITSAVAMINYWNRIAIGFAIVNPAEKNAE
jgi:alkylhydroperoxidase family enzyme